MAAVWLCSAAKTFWAVLHVIKRHGGRVEGAVVIEVEVPRAWLHRSRRGLWYSKRDIGPEHIRRVWTFTELAGTCAA
jgi:hypothetical protein